ncbi:hypothetical protein HPB47_010327 [Ixodes persulcatus]|uniref:Uncharacterized protein n=1 Tax=Ixodes persulcatus TaxID=34615 RepID=A0AC60P019_IXOPE|nr:hypothetical protein HPB47_010327 [Ixodes persulcatus]
MRRNLSFLQRAAQFAMGVQSKQCAEAFERVHLSEALVTKLPELACVTKAEAREKIKSSLRDLNENFLVMAGVVRKKVVCVEPTSGQITLDRIKLDNWLRIRSYLKVGDVLDEPVAECQKAPAKRRHVRKRPRASQRLQGQRPEFGPLPDKTKKLPKPTMNSSAQPTENPQAAPSYIFLPVVPRVPTPFHGEIYEDVEDWLQHYAH